MFATVATLFFVPIIFFMVRRASNPHLLRRPYMQHKDATVLTRPEPPSPTQPHEGAIKMSAIKKKAIKGFL